MRGGVAVFGDCTGAEGRPRTGEFNHSRLVVQGGVAEHWLSGTRVVRYQIAAPEVWKHLRELRLTASLEGRRSAASSHGRPTRLRESGQGCELLCKRCHQLEHKYWLALPHYIAA